MLALPAAFGMTVAAATSASAHYVYYLEQVWSNADSSRCLINRAETSHGDGGGYFKGTAQSAADIDLNPLDCVLGWERNAGELAEAMYIYKWYVDVNGDGSWLMCDGSDPGTYVTNSEQVSGFELIWRPVGPGKDEPGWEDWDGTICGPGYYGIRNRAGMVDSGEWVGLNATVWSGYHWLPDLSEESTATATEDEPVVPNWLKNTDASDDPASVPVADENGEPVRYSDGSLFTVSPNPPAPTAAELAAAAQNPVGERTFTKDADGNLTETVVMPLTRPRP